MNKSTEVQSWIDGAMSSIDNIGRAEPKPFFYTRLEARLMKEDKNVWESMSRILTRPVIAVVAMSLVLFINVFVAMEGSAAIKSTPSRSEMASVEDLRPTSYYDIENSQP